MIEVTVYKTMRHEYAGFDMSGHAGYDDIGKDIVCAAVSVLVINTLNSIERFTDAVTVAPSTVGLPTTSLSLFTASTWSNV